MRIIPNQFRRSRCNAPAYTLIEALLLTIILSIIATGIGGAMSATANSTQANENTLEIDSTLVSQMETLRATWSSDALGTTSSQVNIGGTNYTMTTTIATAAPNTGGVQPTFYSLSIQIAGRTLSTFVSS